MFSFGATSRDIALNAAIRTALKQPSREFDSRIDIETGVTGVDGTVWTLVGSYPKTEIISWDLDQSIGNSDMLGIGGTFISAFTFVLSPISYAISNLNEMHRFKPYISMTFPEITYDSTTEYDVTVDVPLGVYYYNTKSATNNCVVWTVTAYDALYRLENTLFTPVMSGPSFPDCPFSDIIVDLAIMLDVEFSSTALSNTSGLTWTNIPEGMNVRQLLSEMAEVAGCNIVSDRYGKIDFRKYTYYSQLHAAGIDIDIEPDNYITLTRQLNSIPAISGLRCKKPDGNDLYHDNNVGAIFVFENTEITTQAEIETLCDSVYPMFCSGYECKMQGIPIIDLCDQIRIYDLRLDAYAYIFVAHHTISYSGGLISEVKIKAPSQDEQAMSQNNTSTVGTVTAEQILAISRDLAETKIIYNGSLTAGEITNLASFSLQKRGKLVHLQGITVETGTMVMDSTMFTLPEGFRPIGTIRTIAYNNGVLGRVDINTDGTCVYYGPDTSKTLVNINVMFFVA